MPPDDDFDETSETTVVESMLAPRSRLIGLTLAEIKKIPFRIGVAASAAKALPIYGALRGGYLHALITDESAARGVLGLFEQDFRKTI